MSSSSRNTDDARGIADVLSAALAELEVDSAPAPLEMDRCRRAIRDIWLSVVDEVKCARAGLTSDYLASDHHQLVSAAGVSEFGGFEEHGLPILADGGRESWTRFVEECGYADADNAEGSDEIYALAQIRWGQHVRSFALTLGWISMNVLLLRRGKRVIYPVLTDRETLLRCLSNAGPEDYDAESLRCLIRTYMDEQSPASGRSGSA
jgi:hypothetical protein